MMQAVTTGRCRGRREASPSGIMVPIVASADAQEVPSRGASRCRMAPRWYAVCAIAPNATPSVSSSHTACVSTATHRLSYARRTLARMASHPAASTTDTVQLLLRSRETGSPRSSRVVMARLEVMCCRWAAIVVWPGPPGCDAWEAVTAPIVPNTPVPAAVSVKYVQGPGGPSNASRSILVSRATATAADEPVMADVSSISGALLLRFHEPEPLVHAARNLGEDVRAVCVLEIVHFVDAQPRGPPERRQRVRQGRHGVRPRGQRQGVIGEGRACFQHSPRPLRDAPELHDPLGDHIHVFLDIFIDLVEQ